MQSCTLLGAYILLMKNSQGSNIKRGAKSGTLKIRGNMHILYIEGIFRSEFNFGKFRSPPLLI